jgi:BolA protein
LSLGLQVPLGGISPHGALQISKISQRESTMSSMKSQIETTLTSAISPSHMELINESSQHNVPANSETHFKLIAVSDTFEGLNAVKRHQHVYGLMQPYFERGLHALSLHLYSAQEWDKIAVVPDSPDCMGGGK